jgi:hypothetical protein
MSATVFHTLIWTERPDGIMMTLGLEGTLTTREDADRVADIYREWLHAGYVLDGDPDQAFRSRVGVMEIPAPDPRLGHPEPRTDVDQIIAEIRARLARKVPA